MSSTDHFPSFVICGSGTMGTGIALTTAISGFRTILYDLQKEQLELARIRMENTLQLMGEKGKISIQTRAEVMDRITFTDDFSQCRGGILLEAIIEEALPKLQLLNHLMDHNGPGSLYLSNTSSLSISLLGGRCRFPERLAGLHFFNPAHRMKLVEVVQGHHTGNEAILETMSLCKDLDKTPVLVRDTPGFIVNRVARPFYLESMKIAQDGMVNFKTIDELLESSGFKMGPFALTDLIGQDINLAVSQTLYSSFGFEARFCPSPLQEELVRRGDLGRKTGKGFYSYKA